MREPESKTYLHLLTRKSNILITRAYMRINQFRIIYMEVYCEKDWVYRDNMSEADVEEYNKSFRTTVNEVGSSREGFIYISDRREQMERIGEGTSWVSLKLISYDLERRLIRLQGIDHSFNWPTKMSSCDLDEIKARIEDIFLETNVRPRDGLCLKEDCKGVESYHS